ncbi:MAG: prepilin-type N-terminal cleavage/methylation domain-containing protein [Thermoguttaceae bacterium]|nr:prepilin-type N-terminal cleavage/methylation domain-containing protein [Thermoguttaceae bacterium]
MTGPAVSLKTPPRRRGLTLLEVLLVLGLLTIILGVVWQLVSLYSRHYEIGEKRMARTQLVRSISQILTDDLCAAVQDPIHQQMASDASADAIRRFGLRGDSTTLAIDVVEPNLLSDGATVEENRSYASTGGKPKGAQVPELKTIFYEFIPMGAREGAAGGGGYARKFGLSRRELDFETPEGEEEPTPEEVIAGGGSQVIGSLSAPPKSAFMTSDEMEEEIGELENQRLLSGLVPEEMPDARDEPLTASQIAMEMDSGAMWLPEVVECRFRYYDGDRWYDSWNSIERAGLPMTVEVTLRLMTLRDVEELRTSSYRGEMRTGGSMPLDKAAAALDLGEVMTRTLTISLPTTSLQRHKITERRKPTPVKAGSVQRRDNGAGAARAEGAPRRQAQERRAADRRETVRQERGRQGGDRQPDNRLAGGRQGRTREETARPGTGREGRVRTAADRNGAARQRREAEETKPLPMVKPSQEKTAGAQAGAVAGGQSPGYKPDEGEPLPLSSERSASPAKKGGQTWIRTPKK